MLDTLDHLALEVKDVERAATFYRDDLDLSIAARGDDEVVFAAGDTELRLRRPTGVPRGGLHTHYAFSVPAAEYDGWLARLRRTHEVEEHQFGHASSLYLYDPDGNCVELGESEVGTAGDGVVGVFEVVLEVADLERAEAFYTALGFEPIDRGADRDRVRLRGPIDLELWEPQLGIADGRGGVHVDVGFGAEDPDAAVAAVREAACAVDAVEDGYAVRDPDGHRVTLR